MAGFSEDKDRNVIPRWRSFGDIMERLELSSVAPPRTHQSPLLDFLDQKIIDWRKHQTVGHASDLVGAALTLGREQEAIGAAQFLLRDRLNVSHWARELAEKALGIPKNVEKPTRNPVEVEKSTLHEQVRALRHLLYIEPQDPITWVELSRVYAILGLDSKAKRSMTVGLQLANNNRFVLRSASRLWVHLDDPERAHHILIRADRTRHDPWLLAAEIAVGSIDGRKPRLVKIARRMLLDGKFPKGHISELASAVATLELNSGRVKKSKKLFRLSLEDPTENSVAQAAWASRNHNALRLNDQYLELPNAFEAKSWSHYHKSEWNEAVEQCKLWHFDQPFSSRPNALGSCLAAVALEDYETSKWFANRGLMANPADFILLNNLAFALINLDDTEEAIKTLSMVDPSKLSNRELVVFKATQGLLEFRTGNVKCGRQFYSDARSMARKIPNQVGIQLLALAAVFHAFEEISQAGPQIDPLLCEATQFLKQARDPIFGALESRLTKMKTKFQGAT